MLIDGYDVATAAQVAAYFALRSGGKINVLKLSKLLYLAEREYMARYDEPMFYDKLCSMPDGPVASISLNLINGEVEDAIWSAYVEPRSGYDIEAVKGWSIDQFDHLSASDHSVLSELWDKFGGYDRYALRDWTHEKQNIPEWSDPNGSSSPISHNAVFQHLGKAQPETLTGLIEERRNLAAAFRAAG